jgi:DSF synthase
MRACARQQKGLVDKVIAPGTAYAVTNEFIDSLRPRLNGIRAMIRTRRRVFAVTHAELMAITDDWVEAAFAVGEPNVAYVEQLVTYQDLLFPDSRQV